MGNVCKKFCDCLFGQSNEEYDDKKEPLFNSASILDRGSVFWSQKINFEDFDILMVLGRGSFGKVVLAKKKSDQALYAIKILKKSLIKVQNQVDHTKTERQILENIIHPFIVRLHYAFQSPEKLCFVTEYMPGGELFYHLRKEKFFPEQRTKFYACEIILAIEHLHKNNCIYRDLKPENILIDKDGHIRLTDFGLSKIISKKEKDNRAYTICGTPEYLAPEILEGNGYTKGVDWWSLGALIYEMLAGFSPFKTSKDKKLDISLYKKPIQYMSYFSKNAKSLLAGLLTVDIRKRLGSGKEDANMIKNHPFFEDINWKDVYDKNITASFIPKINSEEDYSNFDKIFTDENPQRNTPDKNPVLTKYENFTYVKDKTLLSEEANSIEKERSQNKPFVV